MNNLFLVLVLAVLCNEIFGFSFRYKRQAEGTDPNSGEEDLEDRYGWNRPNRPVRPNWQWPGQFPGQGPFPGQGQFPGQWQYPGQEQFPGQGQQPGQGPFPGQGQQPGQGQFPGQGQQPGQGQFPGQGQQPGQGQFPGQGQQPGQGQFPGQGQQPGQGQLPGQGQQPGQGQDGRLPGQDQQNTTQAPNGSTTVSAASQACMRTCPVTSEYNPVCGTNGQTYDNPGRLTCAQACGVNVSLLRASRCPGTVQAN